jgi:poly-gamma-glutamate synthesis protein (capsule biosynthesis protein)
VGRENNGPRITTMDQTVYYTSVCRRNAGNLLLSLLSFYLLLGCKHDDKGVSILFVGDILLSRNVRTEIEARHTFPWETLKSQFQTYDLVVGNLEGAIGDPSGQVQMGNKSPIFGIDSLHVPLLSQAGFNVITLENNHSLDFGVVGKMKTIEELRLNQVAPVFLDNSPQFFTVKDVVIAVVALNMVLSKDSSKNQVPSIEIKQKLRLARSLAKMVVVSVHWGSELLEWPNNEQRDIAKWLVRNGTDLIIGSHPHVVQKPELVDGKPVFFSLGNHLFDQKYPQTKQGLMVDIRIKESSFTCTGISTHSENHSFYPIVSGKVEFDFNSIKLNNKPLINNGIIIRPVSVSRSKDHKIVLEGVIDGKKVWNTPPMSIVTLTSGKLDGKNQFLFALEKHFSTLDGEVSLRPYVYSVNGSGISARWRGSGLAWPLLDAQLSIEDNNVLCVLHRGDSFINPSKALYSSRLAAYKWNGFGFSGINDSLKCESCLKLFDE